MGIGHSVAKTGVYLNRMSTKHSLVGVCAAVLLFVCFVTIGRAYLVHRAKELITDVQGFDNARDPTAAAPSFAKKYHRYLQETTCDHDVCQYRFVFTNRPLSILHLAKQAQIEALVRCPLHRITPETNEIIRNWFALLCTVLLAVDPLVRFCPVPGSGSV